MRKIEMRFKKRIWVTLAALMLAMLACTTFDEPPGEGKKAEEGYQLGATIIEALEAYHADLGEYPESLDALVPDYLDAVPSGTQIQEFRYMRTDASYLLSFSYTGPGMNNCDYTPEAGEWDCSGYY
jgi:hypothetical protein